MPLFNLDTNNSFIIHVTILENINILVIVAQIKRKHVAKRTNNK